LTTICRNRCHASERGAPIEATEDTRADSARPFMTAANAWCRRISFGRDGLGLSLGFAHSSHHSAGPTAAEEEIGAIGFKARYANALRHFDQLQRFARLRIDPSEIAFLLFPGTVPELPANPSHAGHEAVRIDGAEDLPALGIDRMDLAVAMLPDPARRCSGNSRCAPQSAAASGAPRSLRRTSGSRSLRATAASALSWSSCEAGGQ